MVSTFQTHYSIVRQTVSNRVALVAPGTWLTTACARISAVLILSFVLSLMSRGQLLKKYPLPHITQSLSCAVQGNPLIPCCQRVRFRLSTLVSKMKMSEDRLRCLCSVQREKLLGQFSREHEALESLQATTKDHQIECCASDKRLNVYRALAISISILKQLHLFPYHTGFHRTSLNC